MSTKSTGFLKSYRFPEEFKDTYEKFEKIVTIDPEIKEKATKHQITKGFEAVGVRNAIELYVETKLHLLIQKAQEKQQREGKKNAQTENTNSEEKSA